MALDLEDFAAPPEPPKASTAMLSADEADAERSAAYEQGYSAGWDDAVKAEAEGQSRIGTEFASHLQEMSFSFHEARAHVIEAVQPLLQELADTFLPEVLRDTMGPRLIELIEPMMAKRASQPILITVAPGGADCLTPYLDTRMEGVVQIVEEPTLTEGQAFLRLGQVERNVDLADALDQFRRALSALSQLNGEVLKHG